YYPVIDQLERASGIQLQHSTQEKLERLRTLTRGWGPASEMSIQVFAALLRIEGPSPDGQAADLPDLVAQLFTAELRAIALESSLFIIFEDVHWVDPSTAELLARVMSFIDAEALPILMVLTHRP